MVGVVVPLPSDDIIRVLCFFHLMMTLFVYVVAPVPSALPVDPNLPVIVMNEPLVMMPGETKTITDRHLKVVDLNSQVTEVSNCTIMTLTHRGFKCSVYLPSLVK